MKLKGPNLYCLILLIITTVKLGDAARILSHSNNTSIVIKTIKSEDGDVIDCVDIYHQPAFDHPLLKNHTIKMTPSKHPEGLFESNGNKKQITQLWQLSGNCPEGTVPIRRTEEKKSSITKKPRRSIKIPRFSSSSLAADADAGQLRHEYAITSSPQGDYYGAKATISAWNPTVEGALEFSLSQLWIVAGSGSDLNTIEVGWIVDPYVLKDSRTRLFVYWTRDSYQSTGCYNLECPGFVQTSNEMAVGGSIDTTGNQEITLLVWKDAATNAWWLQYNGINVGYWPTSIFTAVLQGGASEVQWGGEIVNSSPNGMHTATQMGSGRFPEAGFGSASYFRNLQVVNNANGLVPPPSISNFASNPQCYNIADGKNTNWGNSFYYGGPGRNDNCP